MTSALDHAWQKEQSRLRPTVLTPEAVSWSDGPDPERLWVPEDLTPLSNTPSYARLSDNQKLRYNQFYAQQLAEEFHWVETALIHAPLKGVHKRWHDTGAAATVLASFIEDESQHIACFDRLVAYAAEANGSGRRFLRPPILLRTLAKAAATAPLAFAFWVRVIETFETFALAVAQSYRDTKGVDPLFQSVFLVHARDEARHCRYDSLLMEALVETQSGWKKNLNAHLFGQFMDQYYAPGWGRDELIQALVAEFSELSDRAVTLKAEVRSPDIGDFRQSQPRP